VGLASKMSGVHIERFNLKILLVGVSLDTGLCCLPSFFSFPSFDADIFRKSDFLTIQGAKKLLTEKWV